MRDRIQLSLALNQVDWRCEEHANGGLYYSFYRDGMPLPLMPKLELADDEEAGRVCHLLSRFLLADGMEIFYADLTGLEMYIAAILATRDYAVLTAKVQGGHRYALTRKGHVTSLLAPQRRPDSQ